MKYLCDHSVQGGSEAFDLPRGPSCKINVKENFTKSLFRKYLKIFQFFLDFLQYFYKRIFLIFFRIFFEKMFCNISLFFLILFEFFPKVFQFFNFFKFFSKIILFWSRHNLFHSTNVAKEIWFITLTRTFFFVILWLFGHTSKYEY